MSYRQLRSLHLCAGSFAAVFLLAYAVSAIQMGHAQWFPLRPAVTQQTLAVSPVSKDDGRGLAQELMDRHQLRGELGAITERNGTLQFRIARPGVLHEVQYAAGSREARVKSSRAGLLGTINRLHHAAGLARTDWVYAGWGWMVLAVSLSLVVLGATGIPMWFARRTERGFGYVVLAVSLLYSLGLVLLLRLG